MRPGLFKAVPLATLPLLFACGELSTDPVYATVGSEKVYQSDVDLRLRETSLNRFSAERDNKVKQLLSDVALVAEGQKVYPGTKALADTRMKAMETRVLTAAYQRYYAMDRLLHTDAELKKVYNANPSNYKKGDSVLTYLEARDLVATDLYVTEHAQEYEAYVDSMAARIEAPASADVYYAVTKDSAEAAELFTTLQNATKLSDVKGVEKVKVSKGKLEGLFANQDLQSEVFDDSLAGSTGLTAIDSGRYVAFRVSNKRPEIHADRELIHKNARKTFVEEFKHDMMRNKGGQLLSKHRIVKIDLGKENKDSTGKSVVTPKRDSSTVLATLNGQPAIYERDVIALKSELTPEQQRRFSHKQYVDFLCDWLAFATEAKELGLDKTWEAKAIERSLRRNYLKKIITDSIMAVKQLTVEEAKPIFEKYAKSFEGKTIEEVLPFLSELAAANELFVKYNHYYYQGVDTAGPEYTDGILKYKNLLEKRLYSAKTTKFAYQAELANPLREYRETLFGTSWGESKLLKMARCDSLFQAKGKNGEDISKAIYDWSVIRVDFDDEATFADMTYTIAKAQDEDENYDLSIKEYWAFIKMFPDDPRVEQAMFSLGFLLDEQKHRKQDALYIYKRFLEKFPKSEMRESVEWLAKNIETQGKLADDLMKKIEAEPETP